MSEKKIALVTGGTRGIGKGIVERLGADGYTVCFSYVSSDEKAKKLKTLTDNLDYNNRGNGISPQMYRKHRLAQMLSGEDLCWCDRDLRAPFNKAIKDEILTIFGLDPTASYAANCKKLYTIPLPSELKN